jgi:FKBP-type peptidyl-prolyl cis-trans isomerase
MRFTKLLIVMMNIVIVASCQEQGSKKNQKLETKKDSASYALGIQYGNEMLNSLKRANFENEFNREAIIAGFTDLFQEKELKMNAELANTVVNEFVQPIMATQRAAKEAENMQVFAENKQRGEDFLAENAKKSNITVTSSGLQYEILKKGNGNVPKATDKVKVKYKGTLIDGTVFDETKTDPVVFGVTQVIPGWVEALQLMPVGSKWKLYIPQDIAYGSRQAGELIKPYTALIFEIELLGIE